MKRILIFMLMLVCLASSTFALDVGPNNDDLPMDAENALKIDQIWVQPFTMNSTATLDILTVSMEKDATPTKPYYVWLTYWDALNNVSSFQPIPGYTFSQPAQDLPAGDFTNQFNISFQNNDTRLTLNNSQTYAILWNSTDSGANRPMLHYKTGDTYTHNACYSTDSGTSWICNQVPTYFITYTTNTEEKNFTTNDLYDINVIEGESIDMKLNITFNASIYTNINNVWIEYNGTNYSATQINNVSGGDNWVDQNYTASITVPTLYATSNVTVAHTWYINVSDNNGNTYSETTSEATQTVQPLFIDDCSSGSIDTLHFYIFNESDTDQTINESLDITFSYITQNGDNKNVSYQKSGSFVYKFCTYTTASTYTANITVKYGSGSDVRYWIQQAYSLNTNIKNESLYLLESAGVSTTTVTVHVVDEDDEDLENILVEVWVDNVGTGTQYIVSSSDTNSEGEVSFDLNLAERYFFKIYQNGVLQSQSDPAQITDTTIEFIIFDVGESVFSKWVDIRDIPNTLTYNNNTKVVTFTWDNSNNISNTFHFILIYGNGTIVNSQNSSATTGTFTYTITVLNRTYFAYGYTTDYDGDTFLLNELDINEAEFWRNFGEEGLIYAMIIYLVLALAGIAFPELAVILGAIGMFGIYWLGVTSLGTSILMWGISISIIAAIAIVRARKQ